MLSIKTLILHSVTISSFYDNYIILSNAEMKMKISLKIGLE